MVGQLYQLSARDAKARAAELLDRFNLADAADRTAKTYSGGMRRRLDLAAALVVRPPVMFMDEPTTGLDPRNRLQLWEVIEELVAGGTTLLLTTQYLEEADRLAHDIAVVDHGKVIARGTSDQLKAQTGGERIEVVVHERDEIGAAEAVLGKHSVHGAAQSGVSVEQHTRRLTVPVAGGAKLLAEVIRELDSRGIEIDDIGLRRPTLDDVFISLTGHAAEEEGERQPRRGRPQPSADGKQRQSRKPEEGGRQVTASHLGTDGSAVPPSRPAAVCSQSVTDSLDHGQAQPHPDAAHPRGRHLRADPADHVRGAVQLRLRRLHQHPRRRPGPRRSTASS